LLDIATQLPQPLQGKPSSVLNRIGDRAFSDRVPEAAARRQLPHFTGDAKEPTVIAEKNRTEPLVKGIDALYLGRAVQKLGGIRWRRR
jgi:hypothetical protein